MMFLLSVIVAKISKIVEPNKSKGEDVRFGKVLPTVPKGSKEIEF